MAGVEVEKRRKAQEHDFSLVHLALDHPQPPKHPQGHRAMCPWVSLQESHPTSLPTLNSQPHHFLSAFTAWGSRIRTELSLCPLPVTIAFCKVGSTKREAGGIKKNTGIRGKRTKVTWWRFFWSARGAKEGFRQDFGHWQCWSRHFQGGWFSSLLRLRGLGRWSQPGHGVVQTTWSVHLKPVCSPGWISWSNKRFYLPP